MALLAALKTLHRLDFDGVRSMFDLCLIRAKTRYHTTECVAASIICLRREEGTSSQVFTRNPRAFVFGIGVAIQDNRWHRAGPVIRHGEGTGMPP